KYPLNTYVIDNKALNTQESFYTYTLQQEDRCATLSASSEVSRSLLLRVEADETSSYPLLVWNKARIWPEGISHYSLQRKTNSDIFKEIAHISSLSDTAYLDKGLDVECAEQACYRLSAFSKDGDWISHSNITCRGSYSRIFIPNAASPGREDGLNDDFQPRG